MGEKNVCNAKVIFSATQTLFCLTMGNLEAKDLCGLWQQALGQTQKGLDQVFIL